MCGVILMNGGGGQEFAKGWLCMGTMAQASRRL